MKRYLSLVLLVSLSAPAADWPQFRGPTGQGHVEGVRLPLEWDQTKNVVWRKTVEGKGWSSPVVVDRKVYLTTAAARGPEQSLRVLSLDARNGDYLWDVEVFRQKGDAPRVHTKNSHASPTPLVHQGKLYVHFGHQGTACLDLRGKVVWRNSTLRYAPVHGNGGSPVVVDDLLVLSCDGADEPFVVALDLATGKERWRTPRQGDPVKKFSFSTPLVIEVNGQKQVVSPGSDEVSAFDPKTGKAIWTVRYDGYSVIPRPVYGHGLVFIGTGYDSPTVIAIRPNGKGDVTDSHVAWRVRKGAPHTPSLLLVGDELYMVSDRGIASCLDAKTGAVHWQERLGDDYSASPVHGDGRVYFQSENGKTTVVKAGKKFETLATNKLDERTLASFAAADGALFLRTAGHLYRLEAK